MVAGKSIKKLCNADGEIEKGSTCDILKVWLNNSAGDIYVRVKFKESGLSMITSISDIEILNI